MNMQDTQSLNVSFETGHLQDTKFKAQMDIVFASLLEKPKTMLMVSVETNILRANICRYVAMWKGTNSIGTFKNAFCGISKHRADYLTTNPKLFPKSNQLNLFKND